MKYCSRKCINIGKKHTQEWKDSISERNLGSNNHFFGKKHTQQTKQKMSDSHEHKNVYWIMKEKLKPDEFVIYWGKLLQQVRRR
jgi:hypothetical protein